MFVVATLCFSLPCSADTATNNGTIVGNWDGTVNNDLYTNNGTITGNWDMSQGGTDRLVNTGNVGGTTTCGANDDTVEAFGGAVFTGLVNGGAGDDTLVLTGVPTFSGVFGGGINNFELGRITPDGTTTIDAATSIADQTDLYGGTLQLDALLTSDLLLVRNGGTVNISSTGRLAGDIDSDTNGLTINLENGSAVGGWIYSMGPSQMNIDGNVLFEVVGNYYGSGDVNITIGQNARLFDALGGAVAATGNVYINNAGQVDGPMIGGDSSIGDVTIINSGWTFWAVGLTTAETATVATGDVNMLNTGTGTVAVVFTGIWMARGNVTMINNGTVGLDFVGNEAGWGSVDLTNNGTVQIGDFVGVENGEGNATMTNNGTVGGGFFGVFSSQGDSYMVNNGNVGDAMVGADDSTGNVTVINHGDVRWDMCGQSGGTGNVYLVNTGTVATDGGHLYGIWDGSGEVVIINSGTVGGNLYGNLNGTGNCTITNSGAVSGDLIAGSGNDSVTLTETSSVGGDVDGGAGTDTLVFDVATTLTINDTSPYLNFENARFSGNGTIILADAFDFSGGPVVVDGTLTVASNGSFLADSLDVNSANSLNINGAVTVSGETSVDGTLNVNSGGTLATGTMTVSNGNTANISGRVDVSGDSDVAGTLNLDSGGQFNTASLDVSGSADISGDANVTGATVVSGSASVGSGGSLDTASLNVSGSADISGTANVTGATVVSGSASVGTGGSLDTASLNVSGSADISGTANATGATVVSGSASVGTGGSLDTASLTVSGSAALNGDANVTGATVVSGSASVGTGGSLDTASLTVSGSAALNGDANVTGATVVSGSASVGTGGSLDTASLNVSGSAALNGDANVTGATVVSGSASVGTGGSLDTASLNVSGSAALNGDANVTGATVVSGSASVGTGGSLDTASLNVSGSARINGDVSVADGAVVYGSLILGNGGALTSGSLNVASGGSANLGGNAAVNGATTVAGNMNVSGSLSTGSLGVSGRTAITGSVNSGSTDVSGVLVVNGSLTSPTVAVSGGGVVGGSGTINGNVSNTGGIAPGNSIGTLQITGAYIHQSGATYYCEITADGQSDQIITDSAMINGGTLATYLPIGLYTGNMSWTVITAGNGIYGNFDTVTGGFNTAVLSLGARNSGTAIELVLARTPYEQLADNETQRAVGRALDAVVPLAAGNTDDLANLIVKMDFDYDLGQIRQAMGAMAPVIYDAFGGSGHSAAGMFDQALLDRADDLRLRRALGLAGPERAEGPLLAMGDEHQAAGMLAGGAGFRDWRVWARAVGNWSDASGSGGKIGYDTSTGGGVFGADGEIMPWLTAGLGLGYSSTSIGWDAGCHSGDQTGMHYGAYATARWGCWYADVAASYASYNNDAKRGINFEDVNATAKADFDSSLWMARLGGGYDLRSGAIVWGPVLWLAYSDYQQDSFLENGAGGLSLNVADLDQNGWNSSVGLRLAGLWQAGSVNLLPKASLMWLHNFSDDARVISATFRDYGNASPMSLNGLDPYADGIAANLGLSATMNGRLSAFVDYGYFYADNFNGHTLTAGIDWRF